MTRLSQIVAVEEGVKSQSTKNLTQAHRLTQVLAPLNGLSRRYQPRDAEGEQLPSESTRVQHTIEDINAEVRTTLKRLFDVTATKDWANTEAKANVVVNGETLIEDVPVPYLLFLDKQLTDLRTYVGKLPTLDPSETWTPDDAPGVWRTEETQSARTKKVPKSFEASPATKEHPAQVSVFNEDVIVGDWTAIRRSGAVSESRRAGLLERVEQLLTAVKYARQEANTLQVTDREVGDRVLTFVFGD